MIPTEDLQDKISQLRNMNRPMLVLIRGLPGSGKSHLANYVQELIGQDKVVTLDPDETDYTSEAYVELTKALKSEGVDEKFYPYRYLRSRAHAAIAAHQIVLWNQAFTNLDGFNKTITNLTDFAAAQNTTLPLVVIEVEIDVESAKQRVAKRQHEGRHGVSEEAFVRFIHDYHSFAGNGFATTIVQGSDDVETTALQVLDAMVDGAKGD